MRKPEQKFWDLLKKNNVLPGDISRIENTADVGTPDLTCAFPKRGDYWVELKAVEKDWDQESNINKLVVNLLEQSQIVWHARRVKENSMIFVMVRYNNVITTSICSAPLIYETVDVTYKEKNTFNYIKIKNAILNWEPQWFV